MSCNRWFSGKIRTFWDFHDFFLLGASILLAVLLLGTEQFYTFMHSLGQLEYIGIFLAGMLFSYGFTTAPSASVLFVSSQSLNPLLVGLVGATGALLSDYLMFRFFRNSFLGEVHHFSERFHFHPHINKTIHAFIDRFSFVIGGLMIASPLPDEMAISFCGSLKMHLKNFLAIAFVFKFLAIFGIALLAAVV
jgi:uncharacterized membrane protein YdjX (TVP38/TMEM64 family)